MNSMMNKDKGARWVRFPERSHEARARPWQLDRKSAGPWIPRTVFPGRSGRGSRK